MSTFFDTLKAAFGARTSDQRDELAQARFQGVRDAFEKLQAQIPREWTQRGISDETTSQRAVALYALASARMRLAEQLNAALIEELKSPTRLRPSQARMDLENLTSQIDVLTLATALELAQPNSTAGTWETEHHLREAINPPPPSERGEETVAHARALFNGGLVMLSDLQEQFKAREASLGADALSTARVLLTEAQHAFDTLRPTAAQLDMNPALFAARDSALHAELEQQVERMVRLLEGAAAELAVPKVTQTPLWNDLLGDPRQATVIVTNRPLASTVRASGDRPWERDVFCITSRLFTRRNEARANRTLRMMWDADPDPASTWALYQSIQDLEREGSVRETGSYFNACPWTDIWHAETTVRVGNKVVRAGEEFCLHAEIEPNGGYTKEIIVANFSPTKELDYCDTKESRGHGV
jgi:hypothetical protein